MLEKVLHPSPQPPLIHSAIDGRTAAASTIAILETVGSKFEGLCSACFGDDYKTKSPRYNGLFRFGVAPVAPPRDDLHCCIAVRLHGGENGLSAIEVEIRHAVERRRL